METVVLIGPIDLEELIEELAEEARGEKDLLPWLTDRILSLLAQKDASAIMSIDDEGYWKYYEAEDFAKWLYKKIVGREEK